MIGLLAFVVYGGRPAIPSRAGPQAAALCGLDVRYWHEADIAKQACACPLLEVQRTWVTSGPNRFLRE
jgi:hypothetical protein